MLDIRYVLPNHNLFLFTEQPPVDIAGLLSMFQYVPPVVRKRAKELFDTIRDAVKDVPEEAPAVEAVESTETPMQVDEEERAPEVPLSDSATGLWPNGIYLATCVRVTLLTCRIRYDREARSPIICSVG